jgi:hypothetical protein
MCRQMYFHTSMRPYQITWLASETAVGHADVVHWFHHCIEHVTVRHHSIINQGGMLTAVCHVCHGALILLQQALPNLSVLIPCPLPYCWSPRPPKSPTAKVSRDVVLLTLCAECRAPCAGSCRFMPAG